MTQATIDRTATLNNLSTDDLEADAEWANGEEWANVANA